MPLIPPTVQPPLVSKPDDLAVKDKVVPLSSIAGEYWKNPQDRKLAVAVALAESGGKPDVDNGICCVGLWQINRVHAGIAGSPKDKAKFTEWLKDPYNNAKAAHTIWSRAGRTFAKDWEVWMNGSYRNHIGKDANINVEKRTLSGDIGDAAAGAVDKALGPLDEIGSALLSPDTWFRIGKGWLGGVLVVLGTGSLVFIVANKASGGKVAKVAKTTATAAVTKKIVP